MLLSTRNTALRAWDAACLRANLSRGIRKAKPQKITGHFKDSRDTGSLWCRIQTITDYKPSPQTCDSNTSLLNNLNSFFARFETHNSMPPQTVV